MTYTSADELAYRIFGDFFYKNKESFQELKVRIRHSHIPMSVDQYLASAFMYSLFAGIIGGIFGLWLGLKTLGDPLSRLNLFVDSTRAGFAEEYLYLLVILVALLVFVISFLIVFGMIYIYPYLQADIRHACIDKSMLPAVTYMYALTNGGMSIYDVFRSLSSYTHIFGTSAEEISYIVRDMDYLGKDFITALKEAKERTPSERFKDFVDGLILVSSGEAITDYIKNKSEQYQEMAELANRNLLKRLDVLAEVYVTVLVAGPLFIMTTLVVLQFFRQASVQILYMLIYVIIPLATLLFIVLLDTVGELSMSPEKGSVPGYPINLYDIPELSSELSEEEEEKRDKRLKLYRQLYNIKNLVLNPYKTIRNEPRYTFFFGVPLGLYYLTHLPKTLKDSINFSYHWNPNFAHISDSSVQLISSIDDYLVIFIVIALIPFIIFYEIRAWRMRKIDERMPDLLRNLSSMNDSGILLSNSLKIMAESKMGILSKELKKLNEDLSWGTSTSRALMKLENNIRTATSSRILHTLIKANESTSDIKNVLSITSEQVKSEERLKEERSSEIVVYVVTIYVTFFVFLFIVYILVVYFFPESASFKNSSQGMGYGGIGNGYFNVEEYTMLMYHSALVQAFTSGLIAGKMGQGSVYMGLKYSVSMMIITYIVFTMFV
ncbi:integral membrane protein [Methanosarcina siciliae T4/M]|uniref:Integral membrane protein n=2 Tax=Methanosarcina siciliae TaxID=38027 RepID=A0A0E3PA16_9EURY|nr:type II secretion system F family protein [Methanosarcina siciliae]AKB26912.1 integral membrane protein [Methanosarcina siciliae T4/M]AKB30879.1 integral membrane protein [Methanosarcina siciliae HI350]